LTQIGFLIGFKNLSFNMASSRDTNVSIPSSASSSFRGKKASKPNIQRSTLSSDYMQPIMKIIDDPIKCGYFLIFCEQEHSLENLLFVMEVDRFMDNLKVDKKCWMKQWIDTDARVFLNLVNDDHDTKSEPFTTARLWPSKVIQRREVERKMQAIWDTYLSATSKNEICICHHMKARTKVRMELVHL
jgi:hypothetical protein